MMNNKVLFGKNIMLSEKIANYLTQNPDLLVKYNGYSYVVFTKDDKKFNESNEKLVENLLEEGKKVVKVKETQNTKYPWKFQIAY